MYQVPSNSCIFFDIWFQKLRKEHGHVECPLLNFDWGIIRNRPNPNIGNLVDKIRHNESETFWKYGVSVLLESEQHAWRHKPYEQYTLVVWRESEEKTEITPYYLRFCILHKPDFFEITLDNFLHFEKIDIQTEFGDDAPMKVDQLELKTCLVFSPTLRCE